MQRSSYRRGEFFIGASRARPFSATYTVLLPSSALSPSSSSRHPFHLLSRRHQRQPFDDKFSKRVPHHVVETHVENFGSWCPSREAQPTDFWLSSNRVYAPREPSFRTTIHLLAASGGRKRYQTADETTRRHFRHLETLRDCNSSTYHVPILTNSTIRSFNMMKLL